MSYVAGGGDRRRNETGVVGMSTYVSDDVRAGLRAAREKAKIESDRLRLLAGNRVFPVVRIWETGFAIKAEDAPRLRGSVDLFDGERHLYQCLVVASEDTDGERLFEFKRCVDADREAPVDFVRREDAPAALLTAD